VTDLVLLHGALGDATQLAPLATRLDDGRRVVVIELEGHGATPLRDRPLRIESFADDVIAHLDRQGIGRADIFGYSMGGYVAMYLAKDYPQLVDRIITLGTKFHWDEATGAREIKMLNPAAIAAKVPVFAAALEALHAPNDWKEVLQRTADMMEGMGRDNPLKPADYAAIKTTCLIMLGDRDKMVTFEETIATYKQLPNAQMAVLPGTPHIIDQVDPSLIAYLLKK